MDAWRRETIETHCNSRLGIDWLWHRSAAVFAKKLYRAAKIKIDEYNAQKREVRCLLERGINLVGDAVDKQQ
jgi:hypothetical protein